MVASELEKRGLGFENFEVTGGGFIATGPNEAAVAAAAEKIRYRVAFYGSTPAYAPVLEASGFGGDRPANVLRLSMGPDRMELRVNVNGPGDPLVLDKTVFTAEFGEGELLAYGEVLSGLLDADPMLVAPDAIGAIGVVATYLEGRRFDW